MSWWVAVPVAFFLGAAAGAAVSLSHAASRLRRFEATGRADRAKAERLSEGAEHVRRALEALPFGFALYVRSELDLANSSFKELTVPGRLGVVISAAVERQRSHVGQQSSYELVEFSGPPRSVFHVSAHPVSGGRAVVVTLQDVSAVDRLESIRRDFVANISHELRSPVGALALLAETLEDETDPAVVARLSARMVHEAHRMSGVVNDLLELSRLEGGPGLDLGDHLASSIVAEAVERSAAIATERGVRIENAVIHDGPVQADRRQVVTAVSNLIDNAVRFSEGGQSVSVTADRTDSDLTVTVQDSGIGIPAHALDRIFERFYRVDAARTRETGGTGLGLAIVRHVAANHGGDVAVTSTEGVGSRFVLTIPRPV